MHRVTPTTAKIASTETDKVGRPTHVWPLALNRRAENLDYWGRCHGLLALCHPWQLLPADSCRKRADLVGGGVLDTVLSESLQPEMTRRRSTRMPRLLEMGRSTSA